jgi:MerR family transcriptional regulator, light-induced transcriptional regulator
MNMNTMSQGLRIGDLVGRTGVAEPTLRMWERRHGFPEPTRTPSGHRRYTEDDVDQILRVLAGRMAGLSLKAAIERARGGEAIGSLSMFATLRRHAPDLRPCLLHKRAMIALSHAIEDESLARAERQTLFACFQRERFYRQAEPRWHQLAEGAVTAVFADFGRLANPPRGPVEIPIVTLPFLRREWAIVCYGPRSAISLVGREPPSSGASLPAPSRVFEAIWSVDPQTVYHLARACSTVASELVPDVGERAAEILALEPLAGAEEQLRLATAVINRTLSRVR